MYLFSRLFWSEYFKMDVSPPFKLGASQYDQVRCYFFSTGAAVDMMLCLWGEAFVVTNSYARALMIHNIFVWDFTDEITVAPMCHEKYAHVV